MDDIEKSLKALQREVLPARVLKDDAEKEALILAIGGPRTAESVRKAMKTYSKERIPFLFSSLDPQLVTDLMANDVDELIQRLIAKKKSEKPKRP